MASENSLPQMPYVRLCNSGLKVSRIILGCMSFGSPNFFPWILGEEEGIEQIKTALDMGINTFDTADVYSSGLSEVILGKALKKLNVPREEVVIMTKLHAPIHKTPGERVTGNPDSQGYVNQYGLSRKHIFAGIKASLERLQLDYVDVLQCHRFDPDTPVSETMEALDEVVKKGYARYIGMSSCRAFEFHIMQNYAITHNLTPFISMQNHYSLIYREEEREMMPTLKHFKCGAIPWSPLGRGLLSRPLGEARDSKRGETDSMIGGFLKMESTRKIIDRVQNLAEKKGVTMAQIALAWVLSSDVVSGVIVGCTKLDDLRDLVKALSVSISPSEKSALEEYYQPQGIYESGSHRAQA